MRLMLEWIYGGFEERLSLPQAVALFHAAYKFDMPQLQQQCQAALKSQVNMDTYPELMYLADGYYASVLEEVMLLLPTS